jgi:phage gpG-like protein
MSNFPVRVEGADEVAARLLLAPAKVRAAVRRAVEASAAAVTARSKAKLSDDVLHVRTGRLRRSVHYAMIGSDDLPAAVIGTNVEYARIHEYGGTTRAHVIEAINARFLAFRGSDGDMVFRARVLHPGSKMPERSFLRSALGEEEAAIKDRIYRAVEGSIP